MDQKIYFELDAMERHDENIMLLRWRTLGFNIFYHRFHKLWREKINEEQFILQLTYDLAMDTTP